MADLFDFGPFTLDRVKRTLARDGQAVPLTSKAFDLLAFLADHPGETVTKQAILDAVWPGTAVEENTLARSVSMVRKALGEQPADHQYIVTVPGVGYRFIGEPTPPASEPLAGRRLPWRWIAALAVLAAGVIAGLGWYRTLPPGRYTPRRLTSNGRVIKASISPDGTRAVYAAGSIGEESIEIIDIASGRTTVLIPPAHTHYLGLTFDPSGRVIYAPARVATEPVAVLWRIDAVTGARERILDDIESNVSFSPDGKQFAFIRPYREPAEHALMIHDTGGTIRRLAGVALPEWIDYPAWSPDGRVIACTQVDVTRRHVRIAAFDARTGARSSLTKRSWRYISFLAWVDTRTLAFSAIENEQPYGVWELPLGGEGTAVTPELTVLEGASASAKGTVLVSVQRQTLSAVWSILSTPGSPRWRLTPELSPPPGAAWLPSGRVLFHESGADGKSTLYTTDAAGADRRPLTNGLSTSYVSPCPDGSIVFSSSRDGHPALWRIDSGGGNLRQIAVTNGWGQPHCSPDGRWVVYATAGDGKWASPWRVALSGGDPFRLNSGRCDYPVVSPNGKHVACLWSTDPSASWAKTELVVLPIEGGDPLRKFSFPQTRFAPGPRWTPDGAALLYVDTRAGTSRILRQPLTGEPPQPVNVIDTSLIGDFHVSAHGWLITAGHVSSDVVLLSRR